MSTSLAEQLKKLQVPQTNLLLEDKKRPSLLFDPKEAANFDKESILKIGQKGLHKLIELCKLFEEFEPMLFSESSLKFERSVQTSEVNKKLDHAINKFLILLSPFFPLSDAHKALEWIIFKYRIHQFNKDQFLLLILPYHERSIFVRALQLVHISDNSDKWNWLYPLQKSGVPLVTSTLINRLNADNSLLKLLSEHIIQATQVYGNEANQLTTIFAFYTKSLLGVIDQADYVTENQINYLLPVLVKGLVSNIPNFVAGCYMIFAKLSTKVKFNDETMEKLLQLTFKKPALQEEAILLLIFLYESPNNKLTSMPESLVIRLSELLWFPEIFEKIQATKVINFLTLLVKTACRLILQSTEETEKLQELVNSILSSIELSTDVVDAILSSIIDNEFLTNNVSQNVEAFLSQLYQCLEKRYPERFDEYLKTLMKSSETDEKSKVALEFLTTWHFNASEARDSTNILNGLNHIYPERRIMALNVLIKDDIQILDSFRDMMTRTLVSRFGDSDINVIQTLLNFPVKRLKQLLPVDTLIDELIVLLTGCNNYHKKILAKPALEILLELCEEGDDTTIFITSLPYLFPKKNDDVPTAMQVLNSKFAKNNKYMQEIKKDIGSSLDAETLSSVAFSCILNQELLPPTTNILNALKQQLPHADAGFLFFNMLLLGSICRVSVGALSSKVAREIIDIAVEAIEKYPNVRLLNGVNHLTADNIQAALELTCNGILPLQVNTYILEMVHRRLDLKSNNIIDFEKDPDRSDLLVRLLEIYFKGIDSKNWSAHYKRCLEIFIQRHFASLKDLIKFLSQLYFKPIQPQTSFNALQISLELLNKSQSIQWAFEDNVFISHLLLVLARENNDCRKLAVDIMNKLVNTFTLGEAPFFILLKELSSRSSEIVIDPEQLSYYLYTLLSPDPDVYHLLKTDLRKKLQTCQQQIYNVVINLETPLHVRSQLLDVLVHVNGPKILKQLVPLGLDMLQKLTTGGSNKFSEIALRNILQRFNSSTVSALADEEVWKFFETCMLEYKVQLPINTGVQPMSSVLLRQINETFFDHVGKVSSELEEKILSKLIDIITNCNVSTVVSTALKAIRKIHIDASLIVKQLKTMMIFKEPETTNKSRPARRSSIRIVPNPIMINENNWKRGVTLLEFAQRANNIQNEQLLFPILFELLKICLTFEEQSPVEYTNQLILSTVHRLITQKLPIADAQQQVDLIAKCIRTSRNPQTHHHALLVLVELLKIIDVKRALINIMPIFTFVGGSVVKQDDAYSIQIISKTIETVVPIVNANDDETNACDILRTFIVSLPHIPEHRQMPLFVKLLQLLDNHLHLFYLLTFESIVTSENVRKFNQKPESQRFDFALNISKEFSPQRLIQICVKLTEFMRELPVDIENEKDKEALRSFKRKNVFDVTKCTLEAFRNYKLVLLQFIGNLLSSDDFINRVAAFDLDEIENMKPFYNKLMVELVLLTQVAVKRVDQHHGKKLGKYWKELLHNLYHILGLINSLLPNKTFFGSIRSLMKHESHSVTKKALDFLNARLQRKFNEEDYEDLLGLIDSLMELIHCDEQGNEHPKNDIIQQALVSLKLLAKIMATEYPTKFKPVLDITTNLLCTKDGPMLGHAALCVAELCHSMRIHAIQSINKFVPAILRLLKKNCQQEMPDSIALNVTSALQKITESIGNFLSPYLDKLLMELARLNSLYKDSENQKVAVVLSRLQATAKKLSSSIPIRILLPAVNRTYNILLEEKLYNNIPALLTILAETFAVVQPRDLCASTGDLTTFFLRVLQFREEIDNDSNAMEQDSLNPEISKCIALVEESASKSLGALVFHLNEASFRALSYKLYDWAARNPQQKQRSITFFRLSTNLAECLKSFFVRFSGHILKYAADLLSDNNPSINTESRELTLPDDTSKIELVEAVLSALNKMFIYDSYNVVNQDKFDILMQPIVDQIENTIGDKEQYEKRASELIVPCIASFAGAIQDDGSHKKLVFEVLLKTRHEKPHVRRTALYTLVEVVRKLGEDFMSLLPDTVRYLAELLEDEDEKTEKVAVEAVRSLEEILGEPLQKYF